MEVIVLKNTISPTQSPAAAGTESNGCQELGPGVYANCYAVPLQYLRSLGCSETAPAKESNGDANNVLSHPLLDMVSR